MWTFELLLLLQFSALQEISARKEGKWNQLSDKECFLICKMTDVWVLE
jgi:hypothetical protein